jgi:MFS family permease
MAHKRQPPWDIFTEMKPRLPRSIVALGLVSLFMDVSSEMVHGLLPVFLTTTLGASALVVGLIEGVGEATASITKLFSGAWSDRIGRRKPLAVFGYALSALTKPLFALAGSPATILGARFADRVGKGIRGAPRDALVADLVPEGQRGAAYGLRQTLDTIGAFTGPLVAMGLMVLFAGDVRRVFAWSVLPAAVAVAILIFAVREPEATRPPRAARPALSRATLAALGRPFRGVVAMGAILTLARISEAFLILKAQGAGLPFALAPLVLVVMNVVYAVSAWPLGVLSDRVGRTGLLSLGFAVLIAADVVLALGQSLPLVMAGIVLWGLHMGMTQGLLAALVADSAPPAMRGSAFGVFNLVSGLALLAGNALAGGLWSWAGPAATFWTGAGFAAAGLAGFLWLRRGARA